jgi:hypothetical protein
LQTIRKRPLSVSFDTAMAFFLIKKGYMLVELFSKENRKIMFLLMGYIITEI